MQGDKSTRLPDELVITGHRVIEGDETVIGYRVWSRTLIPIPDMARFEKLTILLRTTNDEARFDVEGDKVLAFWSEGGAAFWRQTGCLGYASHGFVRLERAKEEQVRVTVSLLFDLRSPHGWDKECGRRQVKKCFLVREKKVKDLTPWEGSAGATISDEAVRK